MNSRARWALLLLGTTGFGIFGACGGSKSGDANCNPGDTRICLGEGRCEGAQICLADGRAFGACECATSGAGGVSGSGRGGTTNVAYGGASGMGGSGAGTAGIGGAGPGGAAGMGGTGIGAIGGTGGAIQDGGSDAACSLVRTEVQRTPLDILILLDQSGSMVLFEDRWTPIVSAIRTFISSPNLNGVGVGLNYFGFHTPGQPPADPTSPGSCNANDYARPDVPIEVLPGVREKIESSLSAHTPGGGTPTHPALQGAMQYMTARAVANPGRKPIIVLATDGEPQGCTGNDVNTVAQVAAAGLAANPSISTYVIGVGQNLQFLNQIAQAGGSTQAYMVGTGNILQQFLDALQQVRGLAIGCEFAIPKGPGGLPIDFTKLNLLHTPPGAGESIIYYVSGPADCRPDTGGWYYQGDAQGTPSAVRTCPASCSALVAGGRVDFAVGCASIPPPP